MREYAKLAPTFWTGKTGRALKRRGIEGVVVALYLVSSPHSNMLGLFYQPALYLAEETGLPIEGAWKGLRWDIGPTIGPTIGRAMRGGRACPPRTARGAGVHLYREARRFGFASFW